MHGGCYLLSLTRCSFNMIVCSWQRDSHQWVDLSALRRSCSAVLPASRPGSSAQSSTYFSPKWSDTETLGMNVSVANDDCSLLHECAGLNLLWFTSCIIHRSTFSMRISDHNTSVLLGWATSRLDMTHEQGVLVLTSRCGCFALLNSHVGQILPKAIDKQGA